MRGRRFLSRGAGLLLALTALGCLGPRLLGLQVYSVLSGSMEPELSVGSLVYARQAGGESLQEGDIVVYQRGGSKVVHRVVEIFRDQGQVITKGDANERTDAAPVDLRQIKGRVVGEIPLLGYPGIFLRTRAGRILLAALFSGAAAGSLTRLFLGKRRKKEGTG